MNSAIPDIYSFFNDIDKYIRYDNYIETYYKKDENNKNTCNAFLPDVDVSNKETANDVCAKFKNLYKFIILKKSKPNPNSLNDNDFAYLNYWINNKLRNDTHGHNVTVKMLHENMNNRENEFVSNDIFKGKLYDIEYEDFKNMLLLRRLQKCHAEIFTKMSPLIEEKNISCIEHFQEFINTYINGIIKCPYDDTGFCKALKHFKKLYEETFLGEHGMTENCIDRDRLELPTYEDVSKNKQITMVGTVLGPSFGTLFTFLFLYKFTPFGQWIHAKMGSKKGAHSNLYEEHDQSFLYSSDNEDINSDYNQYGISYDSVVNS
ncbi:PIR Superfamily Protein [Plasmodium ovale wallikeri]|uniref:PIR Superfamily Protein n=1 Tax=Plasmodium ovale wallikeri TaxID=864142 RepID=A0A1A9AHJ4_PLAOA|nr:PIR Superfamily Protein [Plasmodium ovale wallikeri]SBT55815.1 PIR Superfamily Protein [Plasmodium ovale wallikeri]